MRFGLDRFGLSALPETHKPITFNRDDMRVTRKGSGQVVATCGWTLLDSYCTPI